ncbi:unnamed protein product, partial [Allacma fusca]
MDLNKNSERRRTGSSRVKKCTKKLKKESKSSTNRSHGSCTEANFNQAFVTGTVLDNHLILKEIFGYLSPADLKSCCEVNEF